MIRIETRGAFVFATLDAPATRHALSDAMVAGLADAVVRAEAQANIRALVIRGAGGTFCAGGDFGRFRELMGTAAPAEGIDPIARFNRGFGALLERLQASPVATIAVVEGAAIGGGVGLAAVCDFVLAASDAKFGMPEVTLGLPPAQIAPFDAAQALACGLADEVLDSPTLDVRLNALLTELGRAEPAALRATKAILHRRQTEPLSKTLDFAASAFAAALRSGTAAEGLAALSAKRPAAWALRSDGTKA